jgi:hypothetical protein
VWSSPYTGWIWGGSIPQDLILSLSKDEILRSPPSWFDKLTMRAPSFVGSLNNAMPSPSAANIQPSVAAVGGKVRAVQA